MSRIQAKAHTRSVALLAAAVLMYGPAAAQTSTESDIVVTAASREQTQAFVSQVAIAPAAADQLGRWDQAICVGVAGLPARQGQFIADRVAQRAFAVGLQPGASGCRPNVTIVVAPDGNAMAQRTFEAEPSLFALRYESGVRTLGQEALTEFLNTARPVRWWHVTREVSADGEILSSDNTSMGADGWNSEVVRSNGSRLANTTRQDFARVIVVVDANRVGGAQLAALADYIAMVTLAQINPHADTSSYPSIMNLFTARGSSAPSQMTQWDLAYLEALYSTSRDAASTTAQQADIARRMVGRRAS
ncbi:MAG: hypothetical protein AB7T59_02525 [Hyphomonadaceae bacterium]